MDKTPEDQIRGRHSLYVKAKIAFWDGIPKEEWIVSPGAIECCDYYELPREILGHIAEFIWHPINGG